MLGANVLSESRLRVRDNVRRVSRSGSLFDAPATDSPKRLRSQRAEAVSAVSARVFTPVVYKCRCGKESDSFQGLRIHQGKMGCAADSTQEENIVADAEVAPSLSDDEGL